MTIEFEWDAANKAHLAVHAVSCAEAEQALTNDPIDVSVQYDDSDGERFQQIGETNTGRVLVIIIVWREDKTRVVTGMGRAESLQGFLPGAEGEAEMEERLKVPQFSNEADEAKWWFEHQDLMLAEFKRAAAEGTLGRGTAARRGNTPTTSIRLDPADISKAKAVAEKRGLKYQTYLKMLIHEALEKETAA